ncbi:hypothetical protein IC762_13140 [Bradyrhizobium genosp. L]|uniref:hypothetical protein n=1 Tax=Bradyrhizobium genosp. L TaxID=83637 RepID=UPI0018A2592F|nr:hypothetical protein [Bradyrhizobium genosp. L]QPF87170.1 hypothetical protein IC762_13140 [Bradyrhizobium genosp. L]
MRIVARPLLVAVFAVGSAGALAENLSQSPAAADNWIISETTSPLDYRPVVVAVARSRDTAKGAASELTISCRNGRTGLVVTGQIISGRGDDYAISYRIDDHQPVQLGVGSPSSGSGAVFPGDIVVLLQSLPDAGEIAIRLAPRTGPLREVHFSLNGLSAVRNKLARACNWPQAMSKPRSG